MWQNRVPAGAFLWKCCKIQTLPAVTALPPAPERSDGPFVPVSAPVLQRLLKPSIFFSPKAGDKRLTDPSEQAGMSHSGGIDTSRDLH